MKRESLLVGLIGMSLLAGCANKAHHDSTEAAACASPDGLAEVKPEGKEAVAAKAPEKAQPVAKFGAESTVAESAAVQVDNVLANPQQYTGQRVRLVGGTVTQVCARKGCWVRVAPKQAAKDAKYSDVFIKFQDPPAGRLVPMEAVGHDAVIEGVVRVGQMSEASARHFKMDGGASPEEVRKIVGPQPQVVLAQATVLVQGVEQPKAGE